MNDCPNAGIRDQLCDVVHGTLPDADRQRVEDHLATCADCAAEIALLRRARVALARRSPVVETAAIVAALPRPRSRRVPSVATWRIAASIAVIAVGAASLSLVRSDWSGIDAGPGSEAASGSDAQTLSFAGRLSNLDDADLEQLLSEIDGFDGVTAVEPTAVLPVPTWDGGTP